MFIDAHCHLEGIPEINELIREAACAGVRLMLSNSSGVESMRRNLGLQEKFPEVKACLGIGPNTASVLSAEELEESLFFLSQSLHNSIAVGEIGLDHLRAKSETERESQATAFREQLSLAVSSRKAVCVHSRSAEKECLEILENSGAQRVLLHWFSGSKEQIEIGLENKYFFSVGPSAIYSKTPNRILECVPLSSLLLETDCPVRFNGAQAMPSWIPLVAKKVAEAKGVDVAEVEKATERNALSLFSPNRPSASKGVD